MAREYGVELVLSEPWNWANMAYCDAMFMFCPFTEEHLALAQLCQQTRTPLWIDYDDDMFNLNRDNHGYAGIMRPEVHSNIRQIVDLADVVTLSTPALRKSFNRPEATVIPNAFNDYVWQFSQAPRNKIVTWRGGPAHLSDLEAYLPAIANVAKSNPDWRWHFFGIVHWKVDQLMPADSYVVHPWSNNVLDYFDTLNLLKPAVHIAPMQKTMFNLGKSNCCWIEATAAGAVTIGPDFPEWQQPGLLRYDDLSVSLDAALRSDFTWLLNESRSHIQNNLLLSRINKQRYEMLCQLVVNRKK